MIGLDPGELLLQLAIGIMAFLWVTTRHRLVGLGYGWLQRGIALAMSTGALAIMVFRDKSVLSISVALAVTGLIAVALTLSIRRRDAGVGRQAEIVEARSARVAAMTGIDRTTTHSEQEASTGPEFPPTADLIAAVVGLVGLVGIGLETPSEPLNGALRLVVGALLLGVTTDAMLLGHWYLVQPGLPRAPLVELVRALLWVWPFAVIVYLLPIGMLAVFTGEIDDGYAGLLGWFWVTCAVSTGVLALVTRAALRERQYSAVMAATGLLYLAILTAFGTDLIARALLIE